MRKSLFDCDSIARFVARPHSACCFFYKQRTWRNGQWMFYSVPFFEPFGVERLWWIIIHTRHACCLHSVDRLSLHLQFLSLWVNVAVSCPTRFIIVVLPRSSQFLLSWLLFIFLLLSFFTRIPKPALSEPLSIPCKVLVCLGSGVVHAPSPPIRRSLWPRPSFE